MNEVLKIIEKNFTFWSAAVYIFMALGHWDKKDSLNKDLDNRQGNCIKQEAIYLKKSHLRFSELLYKLYH